MMICLFLDVHRICNCEHYGATFELPTLSTMREIAAVLIQSDAATLVVEFTDCAFNYFSFSS